MNLIVAVDSNWGIGCANKLLFHIPDDLKFFKKTTMGKVVVMGHSTFKSLPGAIPLKGRENIVLSTDTTLSIQGATVVNSVAQLLVALESYSPEEVFIIGGAQVYALMLEYCNVAYITKIGASARADTYFPNLDKYPQWEIENISQPQESNGIPYKWCKYVKIK